MTQTQHKLRAAFLAALMVLSVFAIGFAGTAVADNRENVPVDLTDGTVIFQGETISSTNFTNTAAFGGGNSISAVEGFTTDDGNTPLQIVEGEIPQNQATGVYTNSSGGVSVIVREPRVTDLEVLNTNSNDVAGGTLLKSESATIKASVNYAAAENVTLTIEEDGTDVTNEWFRPGVQTVDASNASEFSDGDQGKYRSINDTVNVTSDGVIEWNLTSIPLSNIDVGTYTITVEGDRSLDFGDATQSTTITLTDDDDPSISLDADSVSSGEDLGFSVTGASDGDTVTVGIDTGDADDASDSTDIFRDVGDTSNLTNSPASISVDGDDYYFVELVVDGASADGIIDTSDVDTDSVDIVVWGTDSDTLSGSTTSTDDSASVTIDDAVVTLSSPTGTYTIGEAVDIEGTVSPSIDEVRLYVRAGGAWEQLAVDGTSGGSTQNISVDDDNTFSLSDVRLSLGSLDGNNLISQPGSYRIAAVEAEGAARAEANSEITTSAFNDLDHTTYSLVTTTGDLSADFTLYNGQIDTSTNELDIDGSDVQSSGDNVMLILVDSRGNIANTSVSVDDDGVIDTTFSSFSNIDEGTVTAHVISAGRDGVIGSSTNSAGEFESGDGTDTIDGEIRRTGTAAQVTADILSATVDATGSDDQIVSQTFRYADPTVTIDTLGEVAQGDTLTVSGQTNGNPDTDIIVEI
ncbi:UNVERIFIED_CONTAM: hypothetical protein BEN50_23395, partial [Euhalothece sp. KZN 001]